MDGIEDQSRAYEFVGEYINHFAQLESTIDDTLIEFLFVNPGLALNRDMDYAGMSAIANKNESVRTILEHSILNSKFINFQLKLDFLTAIFQQQTPEYHLESGTKIIKLITELQKLRNKIAHSETRIIDGELTIIKAKAEWKVNKPTTLKGGITPPKTGKYLASKIPIKIPIGTSTKIIWQVSTIKLAIFCYSNLMWLPGYEEIERTKDLMNKALVDATFEGGVNNLEGL